MKRAKHKKYGFGTIEIDHESLCNDDEVIFRPDNGIFDRVESAHNIYALNQTAKKDIVFKSDLIFLN